MFPSSCLLMLLLIVFYHCHGGKFVPPSKPDYEKLELIEKSKIVLDPDFIEACKQMAGYYKNPERNPALRKTILITGINYGYKDFLHNFKCFADRLGIKFLPVSLDSRIYKYLNTVKFAPTYLMPDLPGRENVKGEASGFGGKNFNLIGCRKIEAVAGALELGYNVVFSDVDIAIMRDPIDYLFIEGVDYTHSENNGCRQKWKFNDTMEGNTGFYGVKSNPKTIRTWDLAYRACSVAPLYDDQTMFWLILRTNINPAPLPLSVCPSIGGSYSPSDPKKIVSCPLDNCMFSASNLRDTMAYDRLLHNLKISKSTAVIAHANWMNGKQKKKSALARSGLWIAQSRNIDSDTANWTCSRPNSMLIK